MGLRLIRGNSDTPNVTNADDARMVRYAYGGYNGFVQGKGRELDCEGNGATLTINSGIIVLQGWEVEIDSNGWSMQVSGADATPRYFTVYCEVDLSIEATVSIKSVSDTVNYPEVKEGDNLTKITNGVARLVLCHFTAQSGVISNVEKVISPIKYEFERIQDLINSIKDGKIVAKKATEAVNLVQGGTIDSGVTGITQNVTDSSNKLATTKYVHNFSKKTKSGITTRMEIYEVLQYVSRAHFYIDIEGESLNRIINDDAFFYFKLNVSGYNDGYSSYKYSCFDLNSMNTTDHIKNTERSHVKDEFVIETKTANKITLRCRDYIQASNNTNYTSPPISEFYANVKKDIKDWFVK